MSIAIKRIYESANDADGRRVLVDRLWPRGVSKANARIDAWMKDLAPSDALRKWFDHDPAKWAEFRKKYYTELRKNSESWAELLKMAKRGKVTLLFGAHDEERNNAVALKAFLSRRLKK